MTRGLERLLAEDVPVLVQGVSGRTGRLHTESMRRYGTHVVAGVSGAGAKGQGPEGIPVFGSVREAVEASGARASVVMVPPLQVLAAGTEAFEAGLELVVAIAEGVPVHDSLRALAMARACGATWIGPSTPGLAIPNRVKLGFLPDVTLSPGTLGVMSKSGTLSYEVNYQLVRGGLGQTLWVGVGGDPVKGTRFADLVPMFAAHAPTRGMLVIGEIGGTEEEALAEALIAHRVTKPVFALIAGASAHEGATMGHAGALIHGTQGTIESKHRALTRAGVQVFTRIDALVASVMRQRGGV